MNLSTISLSLSLPLNLPMVKELAWNCFLTYMSLHCEKVNCVINCDYSEKVGVTEKILVFALVLETVQNSNLKIKEECSKQPHTQF